MACAPFVSLLLLSRAEQRLQHAERSAQLLAWFASPPADEEVVGG